MRKTVMYMLLAAAVLGMGGCGKANQPASADNGGTEAKKAEAAIELSVFAGSVAENTPTGTGLKAMVDYINENGGGTLKATVIMIQLWAMPHPWYRDFSREQLISGYPAPPIFLDWFPR